MARLDRDGVGIHYEVSGPRVRPEAGPRTGSVPPILLSHGYSATCRMWDGQVAALRDRWKVITWDMRGHGQSDSPEDQSLYSEAHSVADMAAVLAACGETRAVIGGLSLGGVVSMAFHLAHPEMTRALMLFDTGPGFRNEAARAAWNQRSMERANALEERGMAALGERAEVRGREHRGAAGLARAARGMLTSHGDHLIRSLPGVAVPALVLVGSEDTNFLAATDYMAAKIPNATKVVIEGAGHAANLDKPEPFNRAVEAFLARL